MAKMSNWPFKEGAAGWGSHEAMLSAMESAIADRAFILGDTFSMADVIFGGTIHYMLAFKMLEPRPAFAAFFRIRDFGSGDLGRERRAVGRIVTVTAAVAW